MLLPIGIDYRNVQSSEPFDVLIRTMAAGLPQHCASLLDCYVTLDKAHGHQRYGSTYEVHIHLSVIGFSIVASRSSEPNDEGLRGAIRDAFDSAGRQLEDWTKKTRHVAKYGRSDLDDLS